MKQHKKENFIDYIKIFKQASGVLRYYDDPDILNKFIENNEY